HVDASNAVADHWIVRLAEVGGVAAVRHVGVDGIAGLETEEAAARLYRAEEIRGRQREPGQAEGVRGVRLLRGDHAAAGPLIAAIAARERDRAHDAVAVDNGRPHVEVEAAVCGGARRGER